MARGFPSNPALPKAWGVFPGRSSSLFLPQHDFPMMEIRDLDVSAIPHCRLLKPKGLHMLTLQSYCLFKSRLLNERYRMREAQSCMVSG